MSEWVLILTMLSYRGPAMIQISMASVEACQFAGNQWIKQVQDANAGIGPIRALCVRTWGGKK